MDFKLIITLLEKIDRLIKTIEENSPKNQRAKPSKQGGGSTLHSRTEELANKQDKEEAGVNEALTKDWTNIFCDVFFERARDSKIGFNNSTQKSNKPDTGNKKGSLMAKLGDIMAFGSVIVLIASALYLFKDNIDWSTLIDIAGGVLIFMFLLVKISSMAVKSMGAIMSMAMGIALIAGSLYAASIVLDASSLAGIGILLLATAVFGGIFVLIGKFASMVREGALTILAGAISLGAFALVLYFATKSLPSFKSILTLAAAIAIFALIFGIIGLPAVAIAVALGSLAMIAGSISLWLFGTLLSKAASALPDISEILKFGAALTIIGIVFAAAGLLSPIIVLGALAMGIAAAALWIFGKSLESVNANVSRDKINILRDSVSSIISIFSTMASSLPQIILGTVALGILSTALLAVGAVLLPVATLLGVGFAALKVAFDPLKEVVTIIKDVVLGTFQELGDIIVNTLGAIADIVTSAVRNINKEFEAFLNTVTKFQNVDSSALSALGDSLWDLAKGMGAMTLEGWKPGDFDAEEADKLFGVFAKHNPNLGNIIKVGESFSMLVDSLSGLPRNTTKVLDMNMYNMMETMSSISAYGVAMMTSMMHIDTFTSFISGSLYKSLESMKSVSEFINNDEILKDLVSGKATESNINVNHSYGSSITAQLERINTYSNELLKLQLNELRKHTDLLKNVSGGQSDSGNTISMMGGQQKTESVHGSSIGDVGTTRSLFKASLYGPQ